MFIFANGGNLINSESQLVGEAIIFMNCSPINLQKGYQLHV